MNASLKLEQAIINKDTPIISTEIMLEKEFSFKQVIEFLSYLKANVDFEKDKKKSALLTENAKLGHLLSNDVFNKSIKEDIFVFEFKELNPENKGYMTSFVYLTALKKKIFENSTEIFKLENKETKSLEQTKDFMIKIEVLKQSIKEEILLIKEGEGLINGIFNFNLMQSNDSIENIDIHKLITGTVNSNEFKKDLRGFVNSLENLSKEVQSKLKCLPC